MTVPLIMIRRHVKTVPLIMVSLPYWGPDCMPAERRFNVHILCNEHTQPKVYSIWLNHPYKVDQKKQEIKWIYELLKSSFWTLTQCHICTDDFSGICYLISIIEFLQCGYTTHTSVQTKGCKSTNILLFTDLSNTVHLFKQDFRNMFYNASYFFVSHMEKKI